MPLLFIPLSVWTFLRDEGPLIAICIGPSLLGALAVLTLAELLLRKRRRQAWLAEHRSTLQKVLILGYFVASLGRKLPACSKCGQNHYHLWNCGKQLVVYRCSYCLCTYSLSAFSYPEIRHINRYLPALLVLQIWLNKFRRGGLGRHLMKLRRPLEAYCRKRLTR